MISRDTRRFSSLGYFSFSHPEIDSGDQCRSNLLTAISRNGSWISRRHGLGPQSQRLGFEEPTPRLRNQLCSPDTQNGHHAVRPPDSPSTQLGSGVWQSHDIDEPQAMPQEISSRSVRVSTCDERRRTAGTIPP
jgi:hypothetical protein